MASEFELAVGRAADLFLKAMGPSAGAHDEAVAGHALRGVLEASGRRDGLYSPADVDAATAAVVARVGDKFEAHILRPASSVPDELRGAVVSHFSKILDECLTPVAEQLHGGAP